MSKKHANKIPDTNNDQFSHRALRRGPHVCINRSSSSSSSRVARMTVMLITATYSWCTPQMCKILGTCQKFLDAKYQLTIPINKPVIVCEGEQETTLHMVARCDHYTAARIDIWGKPYLDSSDISNVNVRCDAEFYQTGK